MPLRNRLRLVTQKLADLADLFRRSLRAHCVSRNKQDMNEPTPFLAASERSFYSFRKAGYAWHDFRPTPQDPGRLLTTFLSPIVEENIHIHFQNGREQSQHSPELRVIAAHKAAWKRRVSWACLFVPVSLQHLQSERIFGFGHIAGKSSLKFVNR